MASASIRSSASSAGVMRAVAISAALPASAARMAKLSTASWGVIPTTAMPLRGVMATRPS